MEDEEEPGRFAASTSLAIPPGEQATANARSPLLPTFFLSVVALLVSFPAK